MNQKSNNKTTNKKTNAKKTSSNKSKTNNKKTNSKQENKQKVPWDDRWYNQKDTFTLDRKILLGFATIILCILIVIMSLSIAISSFKHKGGSTGNGGGGTVNPGVGPDYPVIEQPTFESNWGVGNGVAEWPDKVFAPFVDIASWPTPNIMDYYNNTGAKYYNLGFINMSSPTGLNSNGVLNWSFYNGGDLNHQAGGDQYDLIEQAMIDARSIGGDITISFGGLSGTAFWDYTQDVNLLYETYLEIVEGYGLSVIDLDIEGEKMGVKNNEANAQAIKMLQDTTGVKVNLTLPVLQSGLISTGLNVVEIYVDAGVEINTINLMTMCYGSDHEEPGYHDDSTEAIMNVKDQLDDIYSSHGYDYSDDQLYSMIGSTPSIGFENSNFPIYTPEQALKHIQDLNELGVGYYSYWCENRDAMAGEYGTSQQGHAGYVPEQWSFGKMGTEEFGYGDLPETIEPSIVEPVEMSEINISDVTFNSATLTFENNQPPGLSYCLYVSDDGAPYETEAFWQSSQEDKTITYQFEDLPPSHSYYVLVAAVNGKQEHTFSNVVQFTTADLPKDDVAPTWPSSAGVVVDDLTDSYIDFSFTKANDNIGIDYYEVDLLKNGYVDDSMEIDGKENSGSFHGLTKLTDYDLEIRAYDFNGNESKPLTYDFKTTDYQYFDYDKSFEEVYEVGDIVWFESQDPDWVEAGIGPQLYEKTKTWGKGWGPDGSTNESQSQSMIPLDPGVTKPDTTGWDHYYGSMNDNKSFYTYLEQWDNRVFVKNKVIIPTRD